MRVHYTHPYLVAPQHKITIDLIGLGGTGSQVLTNLARMNEALMGLTHPGLHVRAWDPDIVTQANMGRQMFSQADISLNKATVLITRVNRFFGYEWEAMPMAYNATLTSNITVTCVDTAKTRILISEKFKKKDPKKNLAPTDRFYYWLDMGNLQKTGQVVLGTLMRIPQQRITDQKTTGILPTVIKKFPQIRRVKDANTGPSCSLAEALEKQDLFINTAVAQFGAGMLWKLIREGVIRYHGCYVNLETMSVNPIKI